MRWLAFILSVPMVFAQATRRDSIVVTGTPDPLPLEEIDRSVLLLPVRGQALLSGTLADFLRLDPSLDLAARAPGGVQADLSIRGATFGQTLFLLNGLRINDAQTAHHNLDIPIPPESISRLEVLRGSGSALYVSDAVGGVVNVIAEPGESTEIALRAAAGNFGVNQQRVSLAAVSGRVAEKLVFSRDSSSGFRPGRDYRNLSLASLARVNSALGASGVVLAYGDKPFGADQFYGNFNSWERTRTWFAALTQPFGANTRAALSFRRHTDLFVLYRDNPAYFANRHANQTWQAALRRRESLGSNTRLHYGVEGFHDSIASGNLGHHRRGRAAGYASLELRALRRFSLSIGAREEVVRSWSAEFSPSISGGVWLSSGWKLRGSVSRAFRVPTYTELYYHDPANLGNPGLRPERSWSYESGLDWNAAGRLRAGFTVFERRLTDGIDYFRRSRADLWRADNISRLRFRGVEASLYLRPARSQELDFRFTGLAGAARVLPGLESKYVFNYPSQSGVASWYSALPRDILLRTRLGVLNRRARSPYALWDMYAACSRGRVHPFVQLANLTGTNYQEIPGVVMPGRAVVVGLEIVPFRRP